MKRFSSVITPVREQRADSAEQRATMSLQAAISNSSDLKEFVCLCFLPPFILEELSLSCKGSDDFPPLNNNQNIDGAFNGLLTHSFAAVGRAPSSGTRKYLPRNTARCATHVENCSGHHTGNPGRDIFPHIPRPNTFCGPDCRPPPNMVQRPS